MNSIKMINILSKQWADVNDIKIIGCCGRDKASFVRDDIRNNIIKMGMRLPVTKTKLVPMKYVVDYFSIDLDYLSKMAEKENNLA